MHPSAEVKMSQVLFEVTEDNLDTGMRGYPVGYCPTSHVDPMKGLYYGEKLVSELAFQDPEKVVYLLVHGKEGTEKDINDFSKALQKRSSCSPELIQAIQALPRTGHPMQLFIAALVLAGMIEGKNDYREDCLNVIAKIPLIAATVINHHAGWGGCNPSKPELGYMENFSQMLRVPNVDEKELVKVFRIFNVLHYDHGGGNLSTFIGKAVSSGLQDMYGSLAAAMSALAGPRHGKANQDCLEFVKEVLKNVGEKATPETVEKNIRNRLENNQLVFGFGHAVLRVEDPRATVLYGYAQKHFPNDPLVKIALLLRTEGSKVLKENPKISDPYPNVDAISGTLLSAAGFPYPEYFTVLFGLSRCVGIARQIVYDRVEARGGKGTPIVRPKYIYKRLEV
jgi:citrate synthase